MSTMNVLWTILFLFCVVAYQYRTKRDKNGVPYKLPPGPRGWPLIGNTFEIPPSNQGPHLEALARKYGEMYFLTFSDKGSLSN
jgi:hypothetical protein